jgi:signal peptidase I
VTIFNATHPDGFTLEEAYLPSDLTTFDQSEAKINLAGDEYFVLGDNRNASKDSRSFGPLGRSYIIGKVLLSGWPLSNAQFFNFSYWPQYNE